VEGTVSVHKYQQTMKSEGDPTAMDRIPVVSSNLRSVGYIQEAGVLEIEFHSGSVYQYQNVPPTVYNDLMTARSKGSFHNAYVKNCYRFRRIR